ncbi:MAG TPA: glycosyltransferase, partial [Thermoanaerobaculia bacterium]|nr:glycosyltransferase [Thermoanaerobaculia bacterium]
MAAILHLNDPMAAPRALRFVFVSSNADWGGSEELWSAAAATLVAEGQRVAIYKGGSRDAEPHLRGLRELGCSVYDLKQLLPFPRGLGWRLTWSRTLGHALPLLRLSLGLTLSRRPDLVVISQGGNHDGVFLAELCRRRNLPFVLISHKASALYWPTDFRRDLMRRVFGGARACYFVSEHNRRLTEEQIGMSLAHASIVRNPFLVPWEVREDWPH